MASTMAISASMVRAASKAARGEPFGVLFGMRKALAHAAMNVQRFGRFVECFRRVVRSVEGACRIDIECRFGRQGLRIVSRAYGRGMSAVSRIDGREERA